jgi:prepilin-type N-terminal cleavage/methylation domain-containing protein/prepilin-type processing-associated H-X9-DG protein
MHRNREAVFTRMISRAARGFTLIELLVVIGILAIIAAILFPVFAKAREKARQTTCLSTLKQLSMATMVYAQDWDETLPHSPYKAVRRFDQANARPNFLGAVLPYLKTHRLLVCPSSLDPDPSGADAHCDGLSCTVDFSKMDPDRLKLEDRCAGPDCSSYVANQVVTGRPVSVVPAPAEIVYLQEFSFRTNAARQFPFFIKEQGYAQWYWQTSQNHAAGGNLLFVDGHVRWRRQEALRSRDFGLNPPDDAPTYDPADYWKTWSAAF